MMIIGSRNKLKGFNAPAPLLISGKVVKFVKQYNYLCIIIDDKVIFQPMLTHVKMGC